MQTIHFESNLITTTNNKALQNVTLIAFGSLLLALAAQITLPLQPVPITLQSFMALFIGMSFGPKLANKIILAYICEGICGLPVFANFSYGLHVLLGPTGGYLFGFIIAVSLVGCLLQQGWIKYRITTFLAALLGTFTIFIPGYLILAKFIGFHNAYLFGVAPFYGIEIVKLALFTFITPFFWKQQLKHD